MDKTFDENVVKLLSDFERFTLDDWKNEAISSLDGKPLEKLMSPTYENITLKPLYTMTDTEKLEQVNNNFPGIYPFLRGTEFGSYKTRKWFIAQNIEVPSPEEYNRIAIDSLGKGQTALILKFNVSLLNTDDDMEIGENEHINLNNGKINKKMEIGTFVSTIEDIESCFKNIDLTAVPVNIKADSFPLMALTLFITYIKNQNYDLKKIKGTLEFDPFMYLMVKGELFTSHEDIIEEMATAMKLAEEYLPEFRVIGINGANFREAGGNAVQELAFSFASAVDYIRLMLNKGFEIDSLANKFAFQFSSGPVFFTEIAKFRASRMLWAKIIKEFCGNEESQKLKFSVQTTNWNKSNLDPHVDILRATTETMSAIIGGADTITTSEFDDNLHVPDEFSRRVARNTQTVLLNECNLTDVIDPSGGSYFVESLTSEIANTSWELFKEVEKMGGMFSAVKAGFPQNEIMKTANLKMKDLSSRKEILLGTNKHANLYENTEMENEDYFEEIVEQSSIQVLKILERIEQKIEKPELQKLYESFSLKSEDLPNAFLSAAESGASFIELIDAVRNYDSIIKVEKLELFRASEIFEQIRLNADNFKAETGHFPQLFLASMGPVKQHKARTEFAREFFSVGGFESIYEKGFANSEEAVSAFKESSAKVIILCSTDDTYSEIVPAVTSLLKDNKDVFIVLAGYPADMVETYKSLGVQEFIHIKANIVEIMTRIQKFLGIK